MSEFFVRRPIVAIVIAILMTLIGGVCILALPIAQYPQIAPPEIQVQTHYTGADALTIEQSVAAPIEQQMSGVDNMNYMYSINANNGDIRLIVNFDVATDPNIEAFMSSMGAGGGGGPQQLMNQGFLFARLKPRAQRNRVWRHHFPVLGMETHGSLGGSGAPFCSSSIECLSGERTNAITPSRGGRLMVTPAFISFSHNS